MSSLRQWMNQTVASWSAAQRLPPCSPVTYPGRIPEGAKTPSPGGPTAVYFCQIIKYEDSPLSCPSWPVAREVSGLLLREQLLHTQPSKAASLLPDRSKAGNVG
ncbi:hypothetical protein I79_018969 [Cricetulus griseus]|uniref:Uncharacterized protein n=1 Tax=Cricetulus griseus TaxID=10029 RepID=G3I657_CRIGR|nr:hypothetical protein I79_018969 [Cricetulus griseus]